jgi:hypothetical protein
MSVLSHVFPAEGPDGFAVIHDGDGFVQFLPCPAGTEVASGQPFLETFTDEAAATARALELGFVFPPPEDDPLALLVPPEPEPEVP